VGNDKVNCWLELCVVQHEMQINLESMNLFAGGNLGHSNSAFTIGMFLYIFPLEVCDLVAKEINVFFVALQHMPAKPSAKWGIQIW
jgi:hypothetical protein